MDYITWTCCSCEKQVEEKFMETDERMCDDCMDEEYSDLPDKMVADEHMRNEVYLYLEQLRETGETNMFGAGEYLEKHFELHKDTARRYLIDWMSGYNKKEEKDNDNV